MERRQTLLLVVEADPDLARFYESELSSAGFDTVIAEDPLAGLEMSQRLQPDLILTATVLPVMSGFEMVRKIRANPDTADVPIVICSAQVLQSNKLEGLVAGADDYLVKPFDPVELIARMRATLTRCRLPGYTRTFLGNGSATVEDALRYLAALEITDEPET